MWCWGGEERSLGLHAGLQAAAGSSFLAQEWLIDRNDASAMFGCKDSNQEVESFLQRFESRCRMFSARIRVKMLNVFCKDSIQDVESFLQGFESGGRIFSVKMIGSLNVAASKRGLCIVYNRAHYAPCLFFIKSA